MGAARAALPPPTLASPLLSETEPWSQSFGIFPLALAAALLAPACGNGGGGDGSPATGPRRFREESGPAELASVAFFDDGRVHDVQLAMDPADWQSIVDDSRGDDWRPAAFAIDGVVVTNVGVRPRASRRASPATRRCRCGCSSTPSATG